MKAFYDFHIHSGLSPCADDDMTPANIVATASIKGLNAIAVSDHNSIKNVEVAMSCGREFGVIVVPAIEVQTSEEIHILALFYDLLSLKGFYSTLEFIKVQNKEHIFGRQLVFDEDNKIVGKEQDLLLTSAKQNIYTVVKEIKEHNGIAILAHIDRPQNGILAILGDIPYDLGTDIIEVSRYADNNIKQKYSNYRQLLNSDAHRLQDINNANQYIKVNTMTIKSILNGIKKGEIWGI